MARRRQQQSQQTSQGPMNCAVQARQAEGGGFNQQIGNNFGFGSPPPAYQPPAVPFKDEKVPIIRETQRQRETPSPSPSLTSATAQTPITLAPAPMTLDQSPLTA